MGSLFAAPSIPAPDPAIAEAKAAEKARQEQAEKDADARAKELERKKRANLLGSRSLQDEEVRGFGGFRSMGSSKPSGSIRE